MKEDHDVAVLDDVFLPFHADLTFFAGGGFPIFSYLDLDGAEMIPI